jgi:RNA polymerase sigma factor (sigma-70 family)
MYLYRNNSDEKRKKGDRLWSELRSGKRDALDGLFRLYYSSLFDYGIRIIHDEEVVKDGIQELFLRLWKRHKHIGSAGSVEAYLIYSLRRILLRSAERRTRKSEYNRLYLDEMFTDSFSIEDVIIENETNIGLKQALLKALNQLNGRQKETLFLRYYHGFTNNEIAEVMEINPQSVRNHLTRAIQHLRAIFNQKEIDSLPASFFKI